MAYDVATEHAESCRIADITAWPNGVASLATLDTNRALDFKPHWDPSIRLYRESCFEYAVRGIPNLESVLRSFYQGTDPEYWEGLRNGLERFREFAGSMAGDQRYGMAWVQDRNRLSIGLTGLIRI
jgi:hypothetical protein